MKGHGHVDTEYIIQYCTVGHPHMAVQDRRHTYTHAMPNYVRHAFIILTYVSCVLIQVSCYMYVDIQHVQSSDIHHRLQARSNIHDIFMLLPVYIEILYSHQV